MKYILHRYQKWGITVAVMGLTLIVALYLFRSVLVAPHIQQFLEDSIASELGIRLEVGKISGSYITTFEMANVATLKPAPVGPLVSMEWRRLSVSYNLFSLFRGLNGLLADATIELDGARLIFDFSPKDQTAITPVETGPPQPFFLPEILPRIDIQDTSVSFRGSGYETAFKGIELEARHSHGKLSTIALSIAECSWSHPDLQNGKMPLSAEIDYSAEKITARRVMTGGKELAEFVQIGLKALPAVMPFDAKLYLAEGNLSLDGKLDHSDIYARFNGDHLDLMGIRSLLSLPKFPLAGIVSMKADVFLPLKRPTDLVANLDLELLRGNIYGITFDKVDLQAAAKEGEMRLDKVDLRTGENLVELRNLSAPAQAVFGVDIAALSETMTGEFSFDLKDIPSLFSLVGVNIRANDNAIPPHRMLLNGRIDQHTIIFSEGSLTTESGHIRLGPTRIALPSARRPLKDTAIQAALEIDFPNLELLSRLFNFPQLGGSVRGHTTVIGTLGAPSGTASITAKGISFENMDYGDLTVKATADSQKAVIESLALQHGKDRVIGQGTFHFVNQMLEDVQLDFRISDLAPYVRKLWPGGWKLAGGKPQITGSVAGKITMKGPLRMPSGTAAVSARQISLEKNKLGDATLRLHSNGQSITVENLEVRQAKDRLALQGSFDFISQCFESVKLEMAIADVAAYTKNLFPKKTPINASIRANLKISGPLKEPEAQADVTLKQLQLSGFNIPSAVFKLRSSGRRISIDLARINSPSGEAQLSGHLLRGPADANFDLEITALTLTGQGVLLALAKPGHIRFSRAGELSLKDISLSGNSGGIRLKGTLATHKKSDLEIIISDVNSHGWLQYFATDRLRFKGLNARIHLFGTMDSPSLNITGDLAQFGSQEGQIFLSGNFDLSYAKEGVTIRQFQWRGRQGQEIDVTGTIPLNLLKGPVLGPGPLSVDATVSLPDLAVFDFHYPAYIPTDGSLQGKLHMSGTWNSPSGTFVFQCRGLNDPPHLKSMPPGPIDIDGHIRIDGKKLVVQSIQINSPRLTFAGQGEWNGMPTLVDLLQGAAGKPTGNVAMKGNLSVEDLSWLAAENPSLRRVFGRLEANVTMKGPVKNPAVDAFVRLTNGELRLNMDVPSLQAIDLEAVATPAGVQLQTLTGELGGAKFQITGSVIRNSQSGARADLRLKGQNLLFYRSEGLKLRADTDLTVKGPFKRLEVAGEVVLTDGRLVKYYDLLSTLKGSEKPKTDMGLQLFSIRKPPFRDMTFDVRLTSKNPFRIRNNLVNGALRPELKLTGTGEFPVLSGTVYVDPTRINVPAGRLVFESGVIRFDPNRPDRPTLDLMGKCADARLRCYDVGGRAL